MNISRLASAIYNDVYSGLQGFEATINMSIQQLEDECVEERIHVIKTLGNKNIIPIKDLAHSISCIPIDCAPIIDCCDYQSETTVPHFQIPPILNDLGESSILYIGSVDRQNQFKVYTSPNALKYQKYKQRRSNKPFVYISTFPNENGMYDGYIYNAPLLEMIRVEAIFKDPRDLENFDCCKQIEQDQFSALDVEIKDRLIKKKLQYYRQMYQTPVPNDQAPK